MGLLGWIGSSHTCAVFACQERTKDEAEGDEKVASAIKEDTENVPQQEKLPTIGHATTLSHIMKRHENLDASMSDLWKLLYFLRSADKLGADVQVLPQPLSTRASVGIKSQKWHNIVRHKIALMDAADKMPATRQSRMAAWINHAESSRKKFAPTLPTSLSVERGQVMAGYIQNQWEVVLVISVWRQYSSGTGSSQLSVQAVPNGNLSAVRAVRVSTCFTIFSMIINDFQWSSQFHCSLFWAV